MKIFATLLGLLIPWTLRAAEPEADKDLPILYRKEALANSLRCLETIRGDDYRTALTRIWVAENLAYLGDEDAAVMVLRNSARHYVIPYGCVESALTLLGHGQNQAVRQLLELAVELLPFTSAVGGEEVQLQVIKMATVLDEPGLAASAQGKLPVSPAGLAAQQAAFRQDWQPSLWNRMLDRIWPERQWADLKKGATRAEQIAWTQGRTADAFTALLFVKEAEARVRRGERYPGHWIEFARTGVRATTPNTRPIAIQAELAGLAALEGRKSESLSLSKSAMTMMQGWPPQMTGLYPVTRDLAIQLAGEGVEGEDRGFFLARVEERVALLQSQLDPYEQMLQLPLLAEALHALGAADQALNAWKAAAERCAKTLNPEGQSIGLTRIWMSYARANTWPTKEIEALLARVEKKLPEAYAKVNF